MFWIKIPCNVSPTALGKIDAHFLLLKFMIKKIVLIEYYIGLWHSLKKYSTKCLSKTTLQYMQHIQRCKNQTVGEMIQLLFLKTHPLNWWLVFHQWLRSKWLSIFTHEIQSIVIHEPCSWHRNDYDGFPFICNGFSFIGSWRNVSNCTHFKRKKKVSGVVVFGSIGSKKTL